MISGDFHYEFFHYIENMIDKYYDVYNINRFHKYIPLSYYASTICDDSHRNRIINVQENCS